MIFPQDKIVSSLPRSSFKIWSNISSREVDNLWGTLQSCHFQEGIQY